MAPTTTIETVTIVRPLKVIAVLCGCIAMFLLMLSIAATTWLVTDRQREGLWELCKMVAEDEIDCMKNQTRSWIEACRALCIIAMLVCLAATICAIIGLRNKNYRWKYTFYKLAMIIMLCALCAEIIALIIFPVKFIDEIENREQARWEFGWAYGIGWGSAIFMFGATVLLYLDKESEEIAYQERTYYNDSVEET